MRRTCLTGGGLPAKLAVVLLFSSSAPPLLRLGPEARRYTSGDPWHCATGSDWKPAPPARRAFGRVFSRRSRSRPLTGSRSQLAVANQFGPGTRRRAASG